MKRAPKKLSTAMRIALNDLKKVEKDPRYTVDMNRWHRPIGYVDNNMVSPTPFNTCHVCFAGSVMAKTLKRDPHMDDYECEGDWDPVFAALDHVRRGSVASALGELSRSKGREKLLTLLGTGVVPTTPYGENPVQWRKDMFKIVHILERIGE